MMMRVSDQSLHFMEEEFAWVLGFIRSIWVWSTDQIVKMTQVPWESWSLWKQVLFVIVAALVAYVLFVAAKQLWVAAFNVLYAVASFIGTLIVTLPIIFLAGLIAVAGMWVINNPDLSSLRSFVPSPDGGGPPGGAKPPPSAPDPTRDSAEPIPEHR
jgi:hypothetical protein